MTTAAIQAKKTASTFRMEVEVEVPVRAPASRVWALLTDAAGFPRWNSTVKSVGGEIRLGQKLELRVPISERTFTPKVTVFEPDRRMVWADGFAPMFRGERTFTLTEEPGGTTRFRMVEVFSGLMLPMIKGSLPDFVPVFETYAADLKKEAEGTH